MGLSFRTGVNDNAYNQNDKPTVNGYKFNLDETVSGMQVPQEYVNRANKLGLDINTFLQVAEIAARYNISPEDYMAFNTQAKSQGLTFDQFWAKAGSVQGVNQSQRKQGFVNQSAMDKFVKRKSGQQTVQGNNPVDELAEQAKRYNMTKEQFCISLNRTPYVHDPFITLP